MFIEIMGWLGTVLCALLSLAAAACMVFHFATKTIDAISNRAYALARKELGSEILQNAYWFSEDRRTYDLLTEVGKDVVAGHRIDVSGIRDKWRKPNPEAKGKA